MFPWKLDPDNALHRLHPAQAPLDRRTNRFADFVACGLLRRGMQPETSPQPAG